ncbi:MAG TPA: thiamine pyrophosphate-dependent dehydrogenase E1 component subunit alpha [bacterium]|nr:thiamine pyrophosphate-dependent dehydrogenase E1 component subunit alpha [bacterium]
MAISRKEAERKGVRGTPPDRTKGARTGDRVRNQPPAKPAHTNGRPNGPAAAQPKVELEIHSILREDGTLDEARAPKLSQEEVKRLYRLMVQNRILDERLTTLQRQGRIGFHIGSIGEEAAIIGSAAALKPEDWLFPCYREAGAGLLRGMPLQKFLNNMFGNAEDPVKGRQMPCHWYDREHNLPSISSPIGTQITHAVGAGMAAKIKGDKVVTFAYFGEGATSSNEFHVGANFAGVFKAPTILFCRNNQWAISVPFNRQTASGSIAIKALAYGITGIRVDGNDLFAVYKVTKEAVERARNGGGATLIEAYSYRLGGHSTSDDPRVYRKDEEVAPWMKRDPIDRLKKFLLRKKWIDEAADKKMREELSEEILAGVAKAESLPQPPIESMFEDVFKEVPENLKQQMAECLAAPRWKGH